MLVSWGAANSEKILIARVSGEVRRKGTWIIQVTVVSVAIGGFVKRVGINRCGAASLQRRNDGIHAIMIAGYQLDTTRTIEFDMHILFLPNILSIKTPQQIMPTTWLLGSAADICSTATALLPLSTGSVPPSTMSLKEKINTLRQDVDRFIAAGGDIAVPILTAINAASDAFPPLKAPHSSSSMRS
ncbi:uncharacterized protein EI90DRAFT_3118770 [Cantharellus anzutake]|uniref:uncharacterized protein n=1 Tax=Cantharellus anzutake TaxID=1750568 RepID=UPI001908DD42|nr:uncharacterized protein EI90DRAFT_3118770 [Cantharellus anzutake]KAF8337324.1 hypothetical protein EI90DRAFT_3118770 [Cantharellus anzutake]